MRKKYFFIPMFISLLLTTITGCTPKLSKAKIQHDVEAVYNKGQLDLLDQYFTADFVVHNPHGKDIRDLETLKKGVMNVRTAFPDLQYAVEDIAIDGDVVAIRSSIKGTHSGTYKVSEGQIPATGKTISITGTAFAHLKGGKIVEEFELNDSLGFRQQLGLIPMKR